MYTRIVVPLDGSPEAEGILPFVLGIAVPLGLVVVLLRVVEWRRPPAIERGSYAPSEDVEASMDGAAAYLGEIADRLRARGVEVQTRVRTGDPVQEIAAGVAATRADAIAMTTHGRSGLGRLLFGSVAEAVLRRADVPVLLMRLADDGLNREALPWTKTA
jgi:nucleotide-binding universal stress UspA family protein